MYSIGKYIALQKRFDTVVDRALTGQKIVGTVVIVLQDGKQIYKRAAGYAKRETKKIMGEDAIFLLSSVTKPIVTVAALSLIEQGKLSLDDIVTDFLPEFKPKTKDGQTPDITIKQLLTHTSGLSYPFTHIEDDSYQQFNISSGLDQAGLSMQENLARLAQTTLAFVPGTSWRYSLSIDVLGAILEKVTGTGLAKIVRTLVTEPLGMVDTDFKITDQSRLVRHYGDAKPKPIAMVDNIELPFFDVKLRFVPDRILDAASYTSAGAGMAGSAVDFIKLLEMIRNGGKPILRNKTVTAMLTNQLKPHIETNNPGWGFGFGGAVLIDPVLANTAQSVGTFRWGGVYGHSWFIDKQNKLSVVALTNTAFAGMAGNFPEQIRDACY